SEIQSFAERGYPLTDEGPPLLGWPQRENVARGASAAPLQFFAEHVEIRPRRRLDDSHGLRRAADADEIVRPERKAGLPVEGDEDLVLVLHDRAHVDFRGSGNDDGAVGQRVRCDWRQHHRVYGWMHDRSAGGQVGWRPSRRT